MLTSIAGYRFQPGIWMVREPMGTDEDSLIANAQAEVFTQTLSDGLRVFALRCGIVGFDYTNWPEGRLESVPTGPKGEELTAEQIYQRLSGVKFHRAMLCNVHLACLYATLTQQDRKIRGTQVIGPNDLMSLDERHLGQMAREAIFSGRRNEVMWYMSLRDATALFDTILSRNDANLLSILDIYSRSVNALEVHNFGLAVSLAWTVSEKLQNKIWYDYIQANKERTINGQPTLFINQKRRDFLEGREFTASVTSEVLSLLGILPFEVYAEMKEVRKGRNEWMHDLKPATLKLARQAIDVAKRMLVLVEQVDLTIKMSARFSLT